MNAIQKTTSAASALLITLAGAVLVTAPMAFARPVPAVSHQECMTSSLQLTLAGHVDCYGVNGGKGLVALNRR